MPKKSSEISKTHRQEQIFLILCKRSEETALSLSEITHILEKSNHTHVNRKTVERDIVEMSEHYKIIEQDGRPARFYVEKGMSPDFKVRLNEKQLQAIFIALENLRWTSHDYFKKTCEEALITLMKELPSYITHDSENFAARYFFNNGSSGRPTSSKGRIDINGIDTLMSAIRQGCDIKCTYCSPYKDNTSWTKVRHYSPLVFSLTAGTPYLVVFDHADQEYKRIRVNRIKDISQLEIKTDLTRLKHITHQRESFGGWAALFNEDVVHFEIIGTKVIGTFFTETEVHPTQTVKAVEHDQYRVTFKCAPSREIIRFLAGFGAEIISVTPSAQFDAIKGVWQKALKAS